MKENQNPPSKKTEPKENTKMEDYDIESVIQRILDCKEPWKIQEKMPLLMEEIDKLKADMNIFLENTVFDIPAILSEATDLCEESKDLVNEMQACQAEIEQETMAEILKTIENHDKIGKELETCKFTWNITFDAVRCANYVKAYEEGRDSHSYSKAVEAICDLLNYLNGYVSEGFEQLDLFVQAKDMARVTLDKLIQDLFEEWDRMVSYSAKPVSGNTVVTLNITLEGTPSCLDLLHALCRCQKLFEKITEFAIFILKTVFSPAIRNKSTVCCDSEDLVTITIHHSKPKCRPDFRETIANMKLLFDFLNNKFSLQYANGRTLISLLGKILCIDFCNLIVNECFIYTVPNNINDLQSYYVITAEIQDFERFLKRLRVFPEDEVVPFLSYMDDIDVLFADNSSQHYLDTARAIMLKDLNVTMSIGLEKIPEDTSENASIDMLKFMEEALDIFEKTIPNSLFYFPRCLISTTAQELLDLVYLIMEQAVQCSDIVCKKLYHTVRLIFELYDAVVPYHNENYLQTIPHFVALFHNNCMYLAHNLQTLGDKWLTLMEGRDLDYAIGFVDLVQKIRELGYKHLTMHMQQQRKQILDNIRSSDLNCIVVRDVLGDNAEAAVRQCLRQLLALKNVWIGVFPSNVFTKLIATLVNMFVDELIHRVCTVEDISMEMATQLTDMYTLVVQKAPQLFTTPTDVDKYVKSWTKLQELIFVLGGSLKDIENHWSDGNGPLAEHFEVDELRCLIKALFQNTQFRANVLSKIK
ncbi:centromere/kinetochore protein zw10 homolog [Pararge aegeria]|uniref:centromere/kinetochore protein zw10 homolog n=1 Tax=Pararge aegeria TaxID=116150 RepID=UPI0019D2C07B|nr:centromere/kinetochore protein zw10 homolog [Pararge aegeria]